MPSEAPVESAVHPGAPVSLRALRNLTLAVVALGVGWRLLRYLLRFPIWGDEAMLCLNLLNRDYRALAHELSYGQVAPFLYMCGEKLAVQLLGTSELAMRLLPLLAGIGALLLCGLLARRTLPPLATGLAVGVLAVAIWPVSMCTQAKPYAFDLFWSLALLLPAGTWLREPQRPRGLIVLTLLVAPALLFSYPAVFVAGAASLAIFATLRCQPTRANVAWFVAFNVVMLAAFLGNYFLIIDHHVGVSGPGNTTGSRMQIYWRDAFPPAAPGRLLLWLLLSHVGELFSYPLGADRGGSIVTVVLIGVGIATLWKRQDRALLLLLVGPFALNLLASVARCYPYAVARLSQHLVPSVVLLMAVGAATLLEAIPSPRTRGRCLAAAFGLLALIALGGMIRDVARPGRDGGVLWMRQVTQERLREIGSEPVVVLHRDPKLEPVLHWYLGICPAGFRWGEQVDWDRLDPAMQRVWTVQYKFNDHFPIRGAPTSHWVACETRTAKRLHDVTTSFPYNIFPVTDEKCVQELQWTLWQRVPLDSHAAK